MYGHSLFFGNKIRRFMDKAKDDPAGGGGGGNSNEAELKGLKDQNADLLKRLEALEGKGKNEPDPKEKTKDTDDLAEKAKKDREAKEKTASETKRLENALKFTLQAPEWLTTNASLLPKDIESIFKTADKEVYADAVEKANAIKVGIVSEFFAIQSNLDLLTEAQKNALEDFKKLTKTDKQERVVGVFETVFEPAFEMVKRLKKAEQVSKGHGEQTNSDNAYAKRMQDLSRKHYLREK